MPPEPERGEDIAGARVLAKLGDSVTTDHISPAGSIKADSPAGRYLTEHGVERKDFNSYGSRRGNHEVMIRGTFANIRLRNQLLRARGRLHPRLHRRGGADDDLRRRQHATRPPAPARRLAGKEYGSGLVARLGGQGHRAARGQGRDRRVYERIHRSNLIGMGVLPLQFPPLRWCCCGTPHALQEGIC
jgi:aconitate hydratase